MIAELPGGQWKTPSFGQSQVVQLPGAVWERLPTSGLLVPRRGGLLLGSDGIWHPKGKPLPSYGGEFGAVTISAAPEGSWAPGATVEEYAHGINRAIGSLSPDVKSQIAAGNPEMGIALDGMVGIINAVTGKEPGWPMAVEIAQVLGDVLTQMLSGQGVIGTAVQQAIAQAAKAIGATVSEVAAVVPFVGVIVQVVVAIIEAATHPDITPAERQALDSRYAEYCRSKTVTLRGTSYDGVSIADMFSQNDARARLWRWLAGGASRNKSVRDAYNSWFSRAKGKYGIVGIPIHVQRQMQEVMDGIFAARRDPNAPMGTVPVTDNGSGTGAILLQITRDQGILNAYNQGSLQSLADNFIAPGRQFCAPGSGMRAGSVCDDYPPCSHRSSLKIGVAFWDFIRRYDLGLLDPLNRATARNIVDNMPKTGTLTLSPALSAQLALEVQGTKAIAEEAALLAEEQVKANAAAKKSSVTKAAALSSAVLLGGGGFLMARRAAKKRRR